MRSKSLPSPHPPAVPFRLYRRGLTPEDYAGVVEELREESGEGGRVRCPLCGWQPETWSLWLCADCGHPEYFYGGCGTLWNTFDTGGLCPGCGHRWRWTACLRCAGWSPHEDWYAADADGV